MVVLGDVGRVQRIAAVRVDYREVLAVVSRCRVDVFLAVELDHAIAVEVKAGDLVGRSGDVNTNVVVAGEAHHARDGRIKIEHTATQIEVSRTDDLRIGDCVGDVSVELNDSSTNNCVARQRAPQVDDADQRIATGGRGSLVQLASDVGRCVSNRSGGHTQVLNHGGCNLGSRLAAEIALVQRVHQARNATVDGRGRAQGFCHRRIAKSCAIGSLGQTGDEGAIKGWYGHCGVLLLLVEVEVGSNRGGGTRA